MKELALIKAQQQHIDNLQKKLDEQKQKITNKLFNTNNWIYFLLRNTQTYYRPRDIDSLKLACEAQGRIEIEFEDDTQIRIKLFDDSLKQSCRLKTNLIETKMFEEFIKDSSDEPANWYWSPSA